MDESVHFPRLCYYCGVYLMGGATKHMPDCVIRIMIDDVMKKLLLEPEEKEAEPETFNSVDPTL